MNDIRLTAQEKSIHDYLLSKNNDKVYWEELVQFAKDPQNVKRKTIQKVVSEIKKKYKDIGHLAPFQITFDSLVQDKAPASVQTLVQVKTTPGGNMVRVNTNTNTQPPAHVDFILDRLSRRVRTRQGTFQLNDNEWEVFKYIHANVGRLIPLSEFRDKVVYPQWGSKLPARWFHSIQQRINNLRRQITCLNGRLLTIPGVAGKETTYLFQ